MGLVVFFLAAVGAIASACAVVFQRNPFVSALALLGNLFCLAALFVLLQADFVAAAQVIVYAGAVMVMFLFVIAYVGPRAELAVVRRSPWAIAAALLAGAALVVQVLVAVGDAGLDEPAAVEEGFGSPRAVGEAFLTEYLIAFEAVSLLLLVAAVAATILGAGPRPVRGVRESRRELAEGAEARRAASAALLEHAEVVRRPEREPTP